MTQKILFFLGDNGKITIDFSGFKGSCEIVGEEFQRRLAENGVVIDITKQEKKATETQTEVTRNVIQH